MNIKFFQKKISRGIIYHSYKESFIYLFQSFFSSLNDKNKITEFEKEFAEYNKLKYCIAFPFARTAIYCILKNLNLPAGSEVIMSPISIKGILDVIVDLNLKPKYVDLDFETINYIPDELQKSISNKTKVVIITPLFGLVPNMDELLNILRQKDIFVIEDFSQCLNGTYNKKRVGSYGDVGVYSASSIKTVDTLGGGLVVTNSNKLFNELKISQLKLSQPNRKFIIKKAYINLLRNLATSSTIFSLMTFPLLNLIKLFNQDFALKQTGSRNKQVLTTLPKLWFCGYSSLQARIGLKKLPISRNEDVERINNVNLIKKNIGTNKFPLTNYNSSNVYWQLILLASDAKIAQDSLAKDGIDSATSSLELLSGLNNYPNQTELTNAKKIYNDGLLIPCYPGLTRKDINRISNSLDKIEFSKKINDYNEKK